MTKPNYIISDTELNGLLHRYTHSITDFALQNRYDPITGRDDELNQMILILLQRMRKNVMMLGPAGIGKTALFAGLAQWINAGKVPKMLQGAKIIELEMSMIGAGSQSRAELEGRLIPIVKGVAERNHARLEPPIIFCIDEFHQLTVPFKASSYAGIADLLKPYLTAGDLYVVGATTREEYDEYVKVEPAIDRRFQKIHMHVPDVKATEGILLNVKANFEQHYGLKVKDETCVRIVKLTDRFMRNRNNPDKSILALDLACAYAVKNGITDVLNDASVDFAIGAEAGIHPSAIK
jgi:ATP-dependent Clp protease ATP-binding subunit ClpA